MAHCVPKGVLLALLAWVMVKKFHAYFHSQSLNEEQSFDKHSFRIKFSHNRPVTQQQPSFFCVFMDELLIWVLKSCLKCTLSIDIVVFFFFNNKLANIFPKMAGMLLNFSTDGT